MIKKLLTKEKTHRLGVKGEEEVLAHPFFADINTQALLTKQIKAPFIPKTPDPEQMRCNSKKVVKLKELNESVLDETS